MEENKLLLKTPEQFIYDMIITEESQKEIKNALAWQGLDYDIVVQKTKKEEDLIAEDLSRLNKLGLKINLKGE
ncbi:MAG: hypothetical protein IJC83_01845 [Oscillospiraceae bacterium]|nr:hypothetical protein [Oscillospiraceae bacterium]